MAFITNKPVFFAALAGGTLLAWPFGKWCFNPGWFLGRGKTFPDRTVIVTGATGNLGRILSAHLAEYKVRVIMACRDLEECRSIRREIVVKTGNKSIACRHLDLEDIDSINRFADEMIKTEPHIDILVNNAAVRFVKEKQMTKYGIERNFFVNFMGPFLLTFRLLDKLKESAAITRDSRIINIVGNPKKDWTIDLEDINFDKRKYKHDVAYKQSKLALAYFTILLHESLKQKRNNIYVFGINPGFKLMSKSMFHPMTLKENVKHFFGQFYKQDPGRAVQNTIMCCLDERVVWNSWQGKLISYMNLPAISGWGEAAKNEYKGKLTWNMATDILLKLPTEKERAIVNKDDKGK